jgi:hypothetical protein
LDFIKVNSSIFKRKPIRGKEIKQKTENIKELIIIKFRIPIKKAKRKEKRSLFFLILLKNITQKVKIKKLIIYNFIFTSLFGFV